jgi:hypothetical protein
MKIKLQNVRLSFPSLFQKAVFEGKEGKFEATFLLDKESQASLISEINDKIDTFLASKFPGQAVPKSIKRTCFQDGDTKDYDGYANQMAIKGGSNRRITIIDRDKTPLTEEDGKLYAGCYVNAVLELWYSDHNLGGKQVLANLNGVQFVKDGEAFGDGDTNALDDFESLEEEF